MKKYLTEKYIKEALDDSFIPEENKHGDCFVVALHKFLSNPQRYKLVHGVVTGQGAIEGIQYTHAWVEDGDTVIDMTLPKDLQKLPKMLYYALGHIKLTREYDANEVYKMMEKYGTYGYWDSVFDDYY